MSAYLRYLAVILFAFTAHHALADEPFDAERTARELLNDGTDSERRDLLVTESAPHAADVIRAMTADLPADQAEENRRIPWIWRVAIEAGRANDEKILRALLDASLPADEQKPLEDWQAVVIGGGIVNGITQADDWPAERITQLIGDDEALQARWKQAVASAARMADNEDTIPGTRYDALRILGAGDWETHRKQITKYLSNANSELQMGAVSAAGDVQDERAAQLLLKTLKSLTDDNRGIAINALLRSADRRALLKRALTSGSVQEEWLDDEQRERLKK